MMNEKTIQPGRYRHYKGNEYTVVGMSRHSETGSLVPSLTTPRLLAAARWPARNASRSSSGPKLPSSHGCGIKRPGTTLS